MNIKDQVEQLLQTQEDSTNEILLQILQELKKININLKRALNNKNRNRDYYNFVNSLRDKLKPNPQENRYPEIHFEDKTIGLSNNGYLYDKETNQDLKAHQAYKLYHFLYDNRDNLERYINFG